MFLIIRMFFGLSSFYLFCFAGISSHGLLLLLSNRLTTDYARNTLALIFDTFCREHIFMHTHMYICTQGHLIYVYTCMHEYLYVHASNLLTNVDLVCCCCFIRFHFTCVIQCAERSRLSEYSAYAYSQLSTILHSLLLSIYTFFDKIQPLSHISLISKNYCSSFFLFKSRTFNIVNSHRLFYTYPYIHWITTS